MSTKHGNLIELFTHIAEQYPHNPALKDCNHTVSYKELYDQAKCVASTIRRYAALGDNVVCITKKDVQSVICFWAILLSGTVPVMLDEDDGLNTNEIKASAVQPDLVLCNVDKTDGSAVFRDLTCLDIASLLITEADADNDLPTHEQIPEICYILLTSGTTGIPKAVQITHKNVMHYTYAIHERLGHPRFVKAGHVTTFAADLGLTNLLVALVSGGLLRIFNRDEATDPDIFRRIIEEDQINLLKMTPSHLLSIIDSWEKSQSFMIDYLLLGGEKLSWQLAQKIFDLSFTRHFFNHYGPTETTIGTMVYKIEVDSPNFDQTQSVPIGRPLGNAIVLLSDQSGDCGELWIGGPCLSKGYIANEAENQKRFTSQNVNGVRGEFFRTGDLCRQLPDGNIEYLYRIDRQVKVRGYRIELGELEVVLASHPYVTSAIADVNEYSGQTVLEAFVKTEDNVELSQIEIKKWLEGRLPSYKIPTYIYFFSHAPFNANGKIDLKALKRKLNCQKRENLFVDRGKSSDSWADNLERTWKSVLGTSMVQLSDNFFESGGDSLHAIQMIGRLQRFGYKINISHLNRSPVFGELLEINPDIQIDSDKHAATYSVKWRTHTQNILLNDELNDYEKYSQSILLETEDRLQILEASLALKYVQRNHAELNLSVNRQKTDIVEYVQAAQAADLGVTVFDISQPIICQIQKVASAALNSISLEKGRMMAAQIFVDPRGKNYLFLICHHWVVDVISWNIIIDDFIEYYQCLIQNFKPTEIGENLVDLFFHKLNYNPVTRKVPETKYSDFISRLPAKAIKSAASNQQKVFHISVSRTLSNLLKDMEDHIDPYMSSSFLLKAFYAAVISVFDVDRLSVDLEFHGRPQEANLPDLSRSVAWWANTVRLNIENEDIGTNELCEILKEKAEHASSLNLIKGIYQGKTVAADVRFNHLGRFPERFANDKINLVPSALNPGSTRSAKSQEEYLIYFTSRFIGGILSIDIQYQAGKIDRSSLNKIAERFIGNLNKLIGKKEANRFQYRKIEGNMPTVGQPLFNTKIPSDNINDRPQRIFLTGSTGFVGIHILSELLQESGVLICCLVRKNQFDDAESRLKHQYVKYFDRLPDNWNNVRVIQGDLRAEYFGMDGNQYDSLADDCDVVIHAAADVNLFKEYEKLKETNIKPVRNIISFARTGKKKAVHYISTLAVSGYSSGGKTKLFTEQDFDYGQQFVSDYEKSKFEAEHLIRQFLDDGGEGKIYRSGHIAADSIHARFQLNLHQNRVFQIIKGLTLLKKIPLNYNEQISFTYVDVVAAVIANIALSNISAEMDCLHIENTESISFKNIAFLLNELGCQIKAVDINSFNLAVEDFEGTQEESEIVHLMSNWVRRHIEFSRGVMYSSAATADLIANFGIYFPPFSKTWFAEMIRAGAAQGYFFSNRKTEVVC